jgi:hypothetical protein
MNEDQKQTTQGVTFRIPSSSINQLREESKQKQISLNTLVNQILKAHLDWHRYAAQAGLFPLPRSTVSRILDKFTEEELSELAVTIAQKDIADFGLLLRGEFTLSSFLNILENWSLVSSSTYKHEVNDDVHNFIIHHNMGRKYSFLIKEFYRYMMEEMLKTKSDFTITDNTVVFRFSSSSER